MNEKSKITIEFDADKFKALQKFGNKKGMDVNEELQSFLQKLYEKNVPLVVRQFIED